MPRVRITESDLRNLIIREVKKVVLEQSGESERELLDRLAKEKPGPDHLRAAAELIKAMPSGDADEKTGMPQKKGNPKLVISTVRGAMENDPTGRELHLIAHAYYQGTGTYADEDSSRFLLADMMLAGDKYGDSYPAARDMRNLAAGKAMLFLNRHGTGIYHMRAYDKISPLSQR